jgi:hypothetical protein
MLCAACGSEFTIIMFKQIEGMGTRLRRFSILCNCPSCCRMETYQKTENDLTLQELRLIRP